MTFSKLTQDKLKLLEKWESSRLITNEAALDAFKNVPREYFVLSSMRDYAYVDEPLPLVKGQTISQPSTLMIMTQALDVKKGYKVLEIGAGSGYQAALLGEIVGEKGLIVTIEIKEELLKIARSNIYKYKPGWHHVLIVEGDGSKGYAADAPYDRIIVTAACPRIPKPLIDQLKNLGVIVAPVGNMHSQQLIVAKKVDDNLLMNSLGSFVFVPLLGEYGFKE